MTNMFFHPLGSIQILHLATSNLVSHEVKRDLNWFSKPLDFVTPIAGFSHPPKTVCTVFNTRGKKQYTVSDVLGKFWSREKIKSEREKKFLRIFGDDLDI